MVYNKNTMNNKKPVNIDKPTKKARYACYQFIYRSIKDPDFKVSYFARSKEVADELARLQSKATNDLLVPLEGWEPEIRYWEVPVFELEAMQKETIAAIKKSENIYDRKPKQK
jgi:hypothetical protein